MLNNGTLAQLRALKLQDFSGRRSRSAGTASASLQASREEARHCV